MLRLPLGVFRSGGAILCFHSLATPDLPSHGAAHVTLEAFQTFIRVARRFGEIVPLSELVRRQANNRSTAGLIAVTFDDAYAAIGTPPVRDFLSRHAVPVTAFVVAGAAGTGAAYWWDRVEDLFPAVSSPRWQAFETECGLPEEFRRGQPLDHGPLRPLRQWVLAAFAGRWPAHLESALSALEHECGRRTRHRPMRFDELAVLASTPGLEFGVHTVSHPVLPLLADQDIREEITACHDRLRERVVNVVPVLAVPFGLYDERTLRASRAAGMSAALTLAETTLSGRSRDRALPRFCMTASDTRITVARRLLGVSDVLQRCVRRSRIPYPALPSPTT
jgi:peptidoglycan/xylan/chitin deacetylase (PgdA/CDA1 family)